MKLVRGSERVLFVYGVGDWKRLSRIWNVGLVLCGRKFVVRGASVAVKILDRSRAAALSHAWCEPLMGNGKRLMTLMILDGG
jgi:hypothetical protein